MKRIKHCIGVGVIAWTMTGASACADGKIKALIVDGQNNHNWKAMTPFMKVQLEKTGLFEVEVSTTPPRTPKPPKNLPPPKKKEAEEAAREIRRKFEVQWASWRPKFKEFNVVISNYNGEPWPEPVEQAFVQYVSSGGGFLVVHAANNSFPDWSEYNKIIGLGGWGGRNEKHGPLVYFDQGGQLVRDDRPGRGGSHGPQHEFTMVVRDSSHPVTRGMPKAWKHARDELYDSLRGPAVNMKILATAWSEKSKRHEPMMMTIDYGKGKVFHTPMGHENGQALQCIGFVTVMNRACEWLATGKVTLPIPDNFPTETQVSLTPHNRSVFKVKGTNR